MEHRELSVEGQTAVASLHVPHRVPAPGVVMCHGFTGMRIEAHFLFVKAARELCAAGMNVLRLDFRGSGESDGLFEDMTIEGEIADARAALAALRAEPTVAAGRVGLLGLSLGGLVAACAAARDGQVKALVLWAAVADLMEVFEQRADWEQVQAALDRDGYVERGAHRVGRGFWEDCRRLDPLAELASYPGPALVVHGSEDQAVPPTHAQRYLAALPTEDKTVHIIEDADHTFTSVAWEREVISVSRDWLTARL